MPSYWLSTHVHVCFTKEHAVLSDLRTDRYIALELDQASGLAGLVEGWPATTVDGAPNCASGVTGLVEQMLAEGILTTDAGSGKRATPVALRTPVASLVDTAYVHALFEEERNEVPKVSLLDISNFVIAHFTAAYSLRCRPIEHTVKRVAQRKRRNGGSTGPVDIHTARRYVRIFRLIRPFFVSRKDKCLLNSLALIDFLARYKIYPDWVFGVATHPFSAHCWVQSQDLTLNDAPDHVAAFTPIMTV